MLSTMLRKLRSESGQYDPLTLLVIVLIIVILVFVLLRVA